MIPVRAQEEGEVVVNLAAGRVAVLVAKGGIVIGATQERVEAESRPPLVVQLSERRVGVVLGAAEWLQPGTGAAAMRMDRQLVRLMREIAGPKRLSGEHADDLEALGLAMLEALRPMTSRLHNKLDVREDEPLLQMVLVGYVPDYGPEVWSVEYRIVQEPVRGSYWRTRVLRPRYVQLYPPEKGQPRTLMEIRLPADNEPTLVDRFEKDPQLARLRTGDAALARASEFIARAKATRPSSTTRSPGCARCSMSRRPPTRSRSSASSTKKRDSSGSLRRRSPSSARKNPTSRASPAHRRCGRSHRGGFTPPGERYGGACRAKSPALQTA